MFFDDKDTYIPDIIEFPSGKKYYWDLETNCMERAGDNTIPTYKINSKSKMVWANTGKSISRSNRSNNDDDEDDDENEFAFMSNYQYRDKYEEELEKINNSSPADIGFPKLQRFMIGALIQGLTFIGAAPSAGKTTFISQWAYNIAKTGRAVIIVSMEMSRTDLRTRDISRLTFEYSRKDGRGDKDALTVNEIYRNCAFDHGIEVEFTDKQKENLRKAKDEYNKVSDNIFVIEPKDFDGDEMSGEVSVLQIYEMMKQAEYSCGVSPVLFIDYLQMLSSPRDNYGRVLYADTKRLGSYNAYMLKQISREFMIPVIVITSTSRDNYNSVDNEAFSKESGDIEYSADNTLFIQYTDAITANSKDGVTNAIKKGQKEKERKMTVSVLKNRAGSRNGHFEYIYHAPYYFFDPETEKTDAEEFKKDAKEKTGKKNLGTL